MQIEAIIFDCDGTLVDSELLGNEVFARLACEHGARLSAEEAMMAFRGRKLAECVAEIEASIGRALPESFVPELRSRTAAAFRDRLRPVDGALALIASLELPYCVASGGPREKIELSLAVTGLLPYFEHRIYSSYDVGSWKPEPGLFLHAAEMMGVLPERCVVVEDSLPGVHAGLAAGMTVLALGMSVEETIPEGVYRIEHLSEISALLGGLRSLRERGTRGSTP